jgi:protein tyrosine/serine phosphatase
MIPRPVEIAFGVAIAALVTVTPYLYQSYHTRMYRNFRVVKDGVLYRSAQLPVEGLERIINDYRIKTVVSLRVGDKVNDKAEEAYCLASGIQFVRIPPRSWTYADDGAAPVEAGLAKFREVMKDEKNLPVLLHCFAGTHRTGAYVAVYRMDFEGWSSEKALTELRGLGYITLDEDRDVFEFLSSYEAVPKKR